MKKGAFIVAGLGFIGLIVYLAVTGKLVTQNPFPGTTPVPQTNQNSTLQLQSLIAAANLQLGQQKLENDQAYQSAQLDLLRAKTP